MASALKDRMKKVISLLKKEYPEAKCSLKYKTPFQLLIATVLSAQCTDERVNKVTPVLFKKYPDAKSLAPIPVSEIEEIIRSTGFYKNKALSIHEISKNLSEEYGGKVPEDLDILVKLRGIGRKTANVVLGEAFGKASGVVVDTHVGRITRRLGFTKHQDPVKVERDLIELVPKKDWVIYAHLMIDHGRAICSARTKPRCSQCVLEKICPKVGV